MRRFLFVLALFTCCGTYALSQPPRSPSYRPPSGDWSRQIRQAAPPAAQQWQQPNAAAVRRQQPADDLVMAIGWDAGAAPNVTVYFRQAKPMSFLVWPESFRGGVRVALGDVDRDGVLDLICTAGPTGGPEVKVYSGRALLAGRQQLIADFFAWPQTFVGGVEVAAGDVNGDGVADIIVGAGPGGSAEVKVYDGASMARGQPPTLLADILAWPQEFAGGVHVAAGDVNGDGLADVIVGAGPGGGPEVKIYDGLTIAQNGGTALLADFHAWPLQFSGGVYVAAADLDGDGYAEVIAGAGPGGGPQVQVFTYASMKPGVNPAAQANFIVYEGNFSGGVRVAALEGDVLTIPGPGRVPQLNQYRGTDLMAGRAQPTATTLVGPENVTVGAFVAGRPAVLPEASTAAR